MHRGACATSGRWLRFLARIAHCRRRLPQEWRRLASGQPRGKTGKLCGMCLCLPFRPSTSTSRPSRTKLPPITPMNMSRIAVPTSTSHATRWWAVPDGNVALSTALATAGWRIISFCRMALLSAASTTPAWPLLYSTLRLRDIWASTCSS